MESSHKGSSSISEQVHAIIAAAEVTARDIERKSLQQAQQHLDEVEAEMQEHRRRLHEQQQMLQMQHEALQRAQQETAALEVKARELNTSNHTPSPVSLLHAQTEVASVIQESQEFRQILQEVVEHLSTSAQELEQVIRTTVDQLLRRLDEISTAPLAAVPPLEEGPRPQMVPLPTPAPSLSLIPLSDRLAHLISQEVTAPVQGKTHPDTIRSMDPETTSLGRVRAVVSEDGQYGGLELHE